MIRVSYFFLIVFAVTASPLWAHVASPAFDNSPKSILCEAALMGAAKSVDSSPGAPLLHVTPFVQLLKAVRPEMNVDRLCEPFTHQEAQGFVRTLPAHPAARAMMQFLQYSNCSSQYKLVAVFEQLALILSQRFHPMWQASRFFGPDGSIGYRGTASHAIIFRPNGSIELGMVMESDVSPGNWWNVGLRNSSVLKSQ